MPGTVDVTTSLNPHDAASGIMEAPMVEIEHLSLWYGAKQALRDVSMSVPKHRVTAYIGPAGCRAPGTVRIGGTDIYAPTLDVTELRKRVGMVFQKSNPFPKSVFENVAYGPRVAGLRGHAKLSAIVEKSLRRAALGEEVSDRLSEPALRLSGGQQQRLCIARALATDPDVLLMDEPASALDPASTARIEALIFELRERYTIVIVTHNLQQAAPVSH